MHTATKIIVFVLVLITVGCRPDSELLEPAPDVSDITVDYKTARIEQPLTSAIDANAMDSTLAKLQEAYPDFYELYFTHVLPIKGYGTEAFAPNLSALLSDEGMVKLMSETASTFADYQTSVDAPLREMFSYLKYYFPEYATPNVYTFVSEFGHQVFIFPDKDKDGVGIGLDMFLGADYPYTQMAKENPAFSQYLSRTFSKEYIPRKVAQVIVEDLIGSPKGNKLIDHMVHNGKRLYIMRKLLPELPSYMLHEYTEEQMAWVQDSELGMWAFFFDENLFYESDMMKINKYINPSPKSPGMPDDAPGRTANYMGMQIIKAYMKKNPNLSLQDLIAQKDAQLIMDESRYKPKRK